MLRIRRDDVKGLLRAEAGVKQGRSVIMSITRAVKISLAWTTIAWIVCYLAFGLIPGLPTAMRYILHINAPMENIFTINNFIVGLIAWNVIVAAGVALAGFLGNIIKD
jgi:hypothetical protein